MNLPFTELSAESNDKLRLSLRTSPLKKIGQIAMYTTSSVDLLL